jgi:hypothetical protein
MQQALQLRKLDVFSQMSVILCTLVAKISISIYILRIKDDRRLRIALWVLMIIMTLGTIAPIIVLLCQCIPLRKLWIPKTPGTCLPIAAVNDVFYVQSALTIVVDLCLTVSPIIILWNIQMRKSKKMLVCFLMSLGLLATICNGLRNYLQKGLTTSDFTCTSRGTAPYIGCLYPLTFVQTILQASAWSLSSKNLRLFQRPVYPHVCHSSIPANAKPRSRLGKDQTIT